MRQDTIWNIIGVIRRLLDILPHGVALRFGAMCAGLAGAVSRRTVDRAERNCVRAMQVGVTRARSIVRGSYANLGRSVAEFSRMPRHPEITDNVVVHGEENLKAALAAGKGAILLSAHMGNWELGAATLARRGFPVNAIGADQRDERVTKLVTEIREACGVRTVSKGFDLKAAFRCLKSGEALAVLIDQDAKSHGVVAPFLGLPASTPYGPVKMAQRIGSAVLPVFMVRRGTGAFHDLNILPPLAFLCEDNMEMNVTLCNNILSEWILKYPEQWLWVTDRWAWTLGTARS